MKHQAMKNDFTIWSNKSYSLLKEIKKKKKLNWVRIKQSQSVIW